jgi:hypothetical protein
MVAMTLEEVEPADILAARSFFHEKYGARAFGLIGASAVGCTAL